MTNNGLSDADTLIVNDTLPSGLVLVSASGDGWVCSTTGNALTCTRDHLNPGETKTVIVNYTVPFTTDSSTICNTANAKSDETIATVQETDCFEVREEVVLFVDKEFVDATVIAGDPSSHTFTVDVTNKGLSDADNVIIDDSVPLGLEVAGVTPSECSETSPNLVHCEFAHLNPSETKTVTVTYTVPFTTDAGTISNTGSAKSDEVPTPVLDTDSVVVGEPVTLVVDKEFTDATVTAGDPNSHTFTIAVTNTGPSDADNVIVDDSVPLGLEVTGVTPLRCSETSPNVIHCELRT